MPKSQKTALVRQQYQQKLEKLKELARQRKERLNAIYEAHRNEIDLYLSLYVESATFFDSDPKFIQLIDAKSQLSILGISDEDVNLIRMFFMSDPEGFSFSNSYQELADKFSGIEN